MAETMTAAEIRAAFEGVYAMESWHDGDNVEHAPAAVRASIAARASKDMFVMMG